MRELPVIGTWKKEDSSETSFGNRAYIYHHDTQRVFRVQYLVTVEVTPTWG